jgi:hypothetical protein
MKPSTEFIVITCWTFLIALTLIFAGLTQDKDIYTIGGIVYSFMGCLAVYSVVKMDGK